MSELTESRAAGAEPTGRSELVASIVLAAGAFIIVTAETLPVGLIGDIGAGLHTSQSGVGLTVTWYALFTAATGVPLTRLTAGVDRRTILVACAGLVVVASLISAAAPNLIVYLAGRAVAALGHGVFFSVAASVLIRRARPEARGRVGARPAVGGSIALVAGTPLATLLGQLVGWRVATAAVGAVALILTVAICFVLPRLPALRDQGQGSAKVLPTLRAPGAAVLFTATAVAVAGHFALFTYIAPFAGRLGLTGVAFSAALFGYGVAAVIGTSSAGQVATRRPVAGAQVAAAAFTVATGGLYAAGVTGSAVLGVPLLLLWSVAFAITFLSTWLGVLRRVPPAGAETAGALYNIVFQLGIVAGSGLGSLFAHAGAIGALPLVASTGALVVFGLTVFARRAYRGSA